MITDSLFHLFLQPLNRTGCRYMVTGAVAGVIYGEPRLTHDLDLVIELDQADIEAFRQAFRTKNDEPGTMNQERRTTNQ